MWTWVQRLRPECFASGRLSIQSPKLRISISITELGSGPKNVNWPYSNSLFQIYTQIYNVYLKIGMHAIEISRIDRATFRLWIRQSVNNIWKRLDRADGRTLLAG